ncbi:MAG: MAPEG family protein [Pseudomonadota bacterium]
MVVTVTPLYAGLLALLFIALSARVILRRRDARVSVGDGDDKALIKRIRTQANFTEYAPMGIVLLLLAEIASAPALALHVLGLALFAGRLMHAYGFGVTPQVPMLRIAGMMLTLLMILVTGLGLIAHALI